jgi:hypothetical protein
MLSRPVEKSTKPAATFTPDWSSPYGLNVEKSDGVALVGDSSWN